MDIIYEKIVTRTLANMAELIRDNLYAHPNNELQKLRKLNSLIKEIEVQQGRGKVSLALTDLVQDIKTKLAKEPLSGTKYGRSPDTFRSSDSSFSINIRQCKPSNKLTTRNTILEVTNSSSERRFKD
jgi:hypothetical protein